MAPKPDKNDKHKEANEFEAPEQDFTQLYEEYPFTREFKYDKLENKTKKFTEKSEYDVLYKQYNKQFTVFNKLGHYFAYLNEKVRDHLKALCLLIRLFLMRQSAQIP